MIPSQNLPIKFKKSFKNVNYYSLPKSILFVVKKRFNMALLIVLLILILILTV